MELNKREKRDTLPPAMTATNYQPTADFHLDRLSSTEKLGLLWALWSDLSSSREQTTELPAWQSALLRERQLAIEEGRAKFVPFDAAMKELRAGF